MLDKKKKKKKRFKCKFKKFIQDLTDFLKFNYCNFFFFRDKILKREGEREKKH